jgi:ABC-type transporter Mla MlaB component
MYELVNQPARRTLTLKLCGALGRQEVETLVEAYREATGTYAGSPHVVLVDVRALQPLEREVETVLAHALEQARLQGVVMCVSLRDALRTLAGTLQGVALECRSMGEAHRLLSHARAQMGLA